MTPKSATFDRIVREKNHRHLGPVAALSVEDGTLMSVAGGQSAGMTRVVLVGRTGIDGALRVESSLEVVRLHAPLEAIGEVAFPTSEDDRSPVVVISKDMQAELLAPIPGSTGGRLGEFVEALRAVNPRVRIVAITDGGPVPFSVLFDAVLRADSSTDAIRAAIVPPPKAVVPPAPPQPDPKPEAKPETRIEPTPAAPSKEPPLIEVPRRAEPGAKPASAGDLALVGVVLKGLDPLSVALDLIRERCGDASIQYSGAQPANLSDHRAPVAWDGQDFGVLTSERTPAGTLTQHAKWLAGWLRLHEQHAQLRDAAFTDHLTGAWNRRYFDRFLATAIEHARDRRQHLTVMVFDIDNFKSYNDQFGHDAGDEILAEIVRLMRSVIRPTDRVCRIGGDEFAVIFHDPEGPRQEGSKHPADVFQIARRFQDQVSRHRFPRLADRSAGSLSVSGGLATFPWDGSTPEQLLNRADELAMQGKRQGKNVITLGPGATQ